MTFDTQRADEQWEEFWELDLEALSLVSRSRNHTPTTTPEPQQEDQEEDLFDLDDEPSLEELEQLGMDDDESP